MDQKFIILKRYPGLRGLSDDVIRGMADECEEVQLKTGEFLHHAGQPLDKMYFVGEGRFEHRIQDPHGNIVARRFLTRGSQFGAVAAALEDPPPIDVEALEPSLVLRLDFKRLLAYLTENEKFLLNFIQDVGTAFKQTFRVDRINTQPNVVLVSHATPASRLVTHRLIDRLHELGERPCVMTDDPAWESRDDVPYVLLVSDGQWLEDSEVRSQIASWAGHERVLIDVSSAIEMPRLIRGFQLADLALVCAQLADVESQVGKLHNVQSHEPQWRDKTCLVWLLQDEQLHPPVVPNLDAVANSDFKVSFESPPENRSAILNHGLERIVHRLRGVQLGIALGGGAARGMAHLGVLKTLERSGIVVDMIAGTSAGAMTGTIYAAGLDVDYAVRQFVHDLTPSWIFRNLRHGGYWYLLHKYRRNQFDPMLRKYLSDLRLEQLAIPMNSITVDLVSGEPIVRDHGDAVDGILESINLPGLSAPICRNGQALVDGGLINNVPADVLVQKGCNFVIAVSVTAQLEKEFANIRPDMLETKYKTPSIMQTIMRGYMVQSVNMNSIGVQPADMMIDVDVTQFDLSEFTRTDELAAVGARTTESMLESIRSELAKLDSRLFTERIGEPLASIAW
jgi:predicted acylesterase/phospholipase RssA/CRP-like cAMP-binding protein